MEDLERRVRELEIVVKILSKLHGFNNSGAFTAGEQLYITEYCEKCTWDAMSEEIQPNTPTEGE